MNSAPSSRRAPAAGPLSPQPPLSLAVEVLGKIAALTTLLVALLYYVGWVYTDAFYRGFGIGQSLLQFSIHDYLMRSTLAAFLFLKLLLLAAAASLLVHVLLHHALTTARPCQSVPVRRAVCATIATAGVALMIFSFPWFQCLLPEAITPWAPALALALGSLLATYAFHLLSSLPAPWHAALRPLVSIRPPILGIGSGLVTLGVFWCASLYADQAGMDALHDIASHPERLSSVAVYSRIPLAIDPESASETALPAPSSSYPYRYTCMRFLLRSGGKLFLLPGRWPSAPAQVITISDTDQVRLDILPRDSPLSVPSCLTLLHP